MRERTAFMSPAFVPHFWNLPSSGHVTRIEEKQKLGIRNEKTAAGIERALLAATMSPRIDYSNADH